LTGAGFGGACVALCKAGSETAIGREVVAQYNATGQKGAVLVPPQ
jgi:galactokinase